MKDYLHDLVSHTFDLGGIGLIKITGTDTETLINAVADDKSVVVEGKFLKPSADFIGTFGMPNLSKLKILLNLPEYKENAKLTLTHKEENVPDGIDFENAAGDFHNNYRFMAQAVVDEALRVPRFKGVNWHVEFQPTVVGIQRLKMQAQAHSEETSFQAKTEENDLKFYFGDHSTHAGDFTFHHGISGNLKKPWSWPIKSIISILDLTGDKIFKISDDGAAMITVDTGLATYNYILPAQTK
jgi:hypothetical protein